ncbi:E3 ubiquitin-protein ligase TRIM21-like [Pholidichthys leucotaenia]
MSICLDVFTNPVTIPCGHNFCKNCITQHWDIGNSCQCPMCKKKFNMRPELHTNTHFSEMVSQFRHESQQKSSSSSSEQQAAKPGEVLCDVCTGTKLNALKSCLVCLTSYCETHLEPHLTMKGLKRHQLMDPVENLEGRMCMKHDQPLELFYKTEQTCICMHCLCSNHKTHDVVPLREECEGKKIEEIKESVKSKDAADGEKAEGVQVFTALKESVERCLNKFIKEIEDTQKTMEKQAEDSIKYLEQEISELMKRSSEKKKKLKEAELKRAQQYAVDVTLDLDTAQPYLILSDDGKQVKHGYERKNLPDNPERFSLCSCVLGNQSFSSGRFYFEVQDKGKTEWDLGMARESINRKGQITLGPQNGYWTSGPEKVGVFVDYEEGLVSFYDVDAAALIYSFTCCSFNHRLRPYFSPDNNNGGKHPDGKCDRESMETVSHIIIHCTKYAEQRRKLFRDLGSAGETVFNMYTLMNLDSWSKVKQLLEYLHRAGLYGRI